MQDNRTFLSIHGALTGAAIGDALAAPTERRSYRQILTYFGGPVRDFKEPPQDTPSHDRSPGQITDAFGIPYTILQELVQNGWGLTRETAAKGLATWGNDEDLLQRFGGLTTKKVVNRLLHGEERMDYWQYSGQLGNKLYKTHYYALSTNGAATKAILVPLVVDKEQLVDATVELTMSSHDDKYSISGALASATMVACAFDAKKSIDHLITDALEAATHGEKIGEEIALDYPGPSVRKRMEMALEIVVAEASRDQMLDKLRMLIGSGPAISETVPVAFALMLAYFKDPLEGLFAAVNMGDESCAIATLVGAFFGARFGATLFPKEMQARLQSANAFDLEKLAQDLLTYRRNR